MLPLTIACSKSPPSPPAVTPPTAGETISGTERIGWTQRAADAVELSSLRYTIFVDGARSELAGAQCDTTATAEGFACSARLPAMSAGAHTLELSSFINDGGILESGRSAALRVTVAAIVEAATSVVADASLWAAAEKGIGSLSDGTHLRVERVADELRQPTDLAFAPDGRLFIAERAGTIRIAREGAVSDPIPVAETLARGDRLLALAIDPDFARTRFVYAVIVSGRHFALLRAREVAGTLGDRSVLLDGVAAPASDPSAALRFGPDGKLYLAFDDGGEPQRVGDLSSPNGKILRVNADGTTPDDQAGGSPTYVAASRAPVGIDWQPQSGALWLADRSGPSIIAIGAESSGRGQAVRGVVRQRWSLPAASKPSAATFVRGGLIPTLAGDLLLASSEGRQLLRVRFDPLDRSRVAATEPLLQDLLGPIAAVAAGPDGAIYFATSTSVGRLAPE